MRKAKKKKTLLCELDRDRPQVLHRGYTDFPSNGFTPIVQRRRESLGRLRSSPSRLIQNTRPTLLRVRGTG